MRASSSTRMELSSPGRMIIFPLLNIGFSALMTMAHVDDGVPVVLTDPSPAVYIVVSMSFICSISV